MTEIQLSAGMAPEEALRIATGADEGCRPLIFPGIYDWFHPCGDSFALPSNQF
jgi:hypothetical protein